MKIKKFYKEETDKINYFKAGNELLNFLSRVEVKYKPNTLKEPHYNDYYLGDEENYQKTKQDYYLSQKSSYEQDGKELIEKFKVELAEYVISIRKDKESGELACQNLIQAISYIENKVIEEHNQSLSALTKEENSDALKNEFTSFFDIHFKFIEETKELIRDKFTTFYKQIIDIPPFKFNIEKNKVVILFMLLRESGILGNNLTEKEFKLFAESFFLYQDQKDKQHKPITHFAQEINRITNDARGEEAKKELLKRLNETEITREFNF
jgi:uncharacterized protein YecA (UPF0149 family)